MTAVALLAVLPALLAQARNPSPRELLDLRPLTITEIAAVLNASRRALTAKTFRLSSLPKDIRYCGAPAATPTYLSAPP
jgi:hypothetical protein